MFVISHEKEVVVVFSQFRHIVVVIESSDGLCHIETLGMEDLRKILHQSYQQCIIIDIQFLQVKIDAGKAVLPAY